VPDVPAIHVVYVEAMLLVASMIKDVNDFYKGCANPTIVCHRKHSRAPNETLQVCSGTEIHKDFWTMSSLYSKSPSFLWFYIYGLLKTANEVVVEGMCTFIGRQAGSSRGLSFGR
jgi:hypothetical protein